MLVRNAVARLFGRSPGNAVAQGQGLHPRASDPAARLAQLRAVRQEQDHKALRRSLDDHLIDVLSEVVIGYIEPADPLSLAQLKALTAKDAPPPDGIDSLSWKTWRPGLSSALRQLVPDGPQRGVPDGAADVGGGAWKDLMFELERSGFGPTRPAFMQALACGFKPEWARHATAAQLVEMTRWNPAVLTPDIVHERGPVLASAAIQSTDPDVLKVVLDGAQGPLSEHFVRQVRNALAFAVWKHDTDPAKLGECVAVLCERMRSDKGLHRSLTGLPSRSFAPANFGEYANTVMRSGLGLAQKKGLLNVAEDHGLVARLIARERMGDSDREAAIRGAKRILAALRAVPDSGEAGSLAKHLLPKGCSASRLEGLLLETEGPADSKGAGR